VQYVSPYGVGLNIVQTAGRENLNVMSSPLCVFVAVLGTVMKITTLFWDVGGVILTNGWDRSSRREGAEKFNLDWDEFEARHQAEVEAFDCGELSVKDYLERTIFYRHRSFSREDFKAFMFAQSRSYEATVAIVEGLARARKYLMVTMNNESLELNLFRIERFRLREFFTVFFSSCYLGVRKPDEVIYRRSLQITQRDPAECLLIDDRAENIIPARQAGMRSIHYRDPGQLWHDLRVSGIEL
jgi:putative hydrolase of the HAD superfamily